MEYNKKDQRNEVDLDSSDDSTHYQDFHEVDYDFFYEKNYAYYKDEEVSAKILSQNNIINRVKRYSNKRYREVKAFYEYSVEEHKDYFTNKGNIWRQKQQAQRDREFIKMLLFVIIVLAMLMGFMLWSSRL